MTKNTKNILINENENENENTHITKIISLLETISQNLTPVEKAPQKDTTKHFNEKSRTKQSFKDLCDINLIVGKHASGETTFHINPKEPVYGDFTEASDLQTALNNVQLAEDQFMSLPPELRALCDNKPEKLLELAANPETAIKLADLGAKELVEHLHGPLEPIETPPSIPPVQPPEAPNQPSGHPALPKETPD